MPQDAGHRDDHDHGDGLHEDLVRLASRRDALKIFGAGGAAAILATLGASRALGATPTGAVPTETAGPYPGDGSNGPDVLDDAGIVRHDIRRSSGSSRTLAKGIPLRVNLTVTEAAKDLRADDRRRRLPVALRPLGQVLHVLPRGRGRELPARDREDQRQRHRLVHHHLPRLLLRTLATDNVFRDDKAIHQLATVTGSAGKGYVANLTIGA